MVYLEIVTEIPRGKVQEAWDYYKSKIMKFDKESVEKVGGKYIGYWYTEYGKEGEITVLVAYKNLEDREKLLDLMFNQWGKQFLKDYETWAAYTPIRTVKVLRPFPESPLQ